MPPEQEGSPISVTVERAGARFVTVGDGWVGNFGFSYGEHYDPARLSFGSMLACNEFVLEPGAGFGLHRHAGIDVVTTVLSGALTHVVEQSREVRERGSYLLSTGSGVKHDDRNDGGGPVRFIQAWFLPGTPDPRPQWHELASGVGVEVLPRAYALVVAGEVSLQGEVLREGDSVQVGQPVALVAKTAVHLLVWPC